MSINLSSNRGSLKKVLPVVVIAVAMLAVAGYVFVHAVNAAKPSDFGLKEGDTISATGSSDPDVYIINDAGFKRLWWRYRGRG